MLMSRNIIVTSSAAQYTGMFSIHVRLWRILPADFTVSCFSCWFVYFPLSR